MNLRALGPDRNAHLVILLGNLLSLKIVWQNIDANVEGSPVSGINVGFPQGPRKQIGHWGWRGERKGESKRNLDLICQELAGEDRMEVGAAGKLPSNYRLYRRFPSRRLGPLRATG